jgi:predicted nucleotidyltransferase
MSLNKEDLIKISTNILGIPQDKHDDLICLYQWGSHLFGTNGPNSDYDLVAVLRGYNYGVLKGKSDFAPDWQLVADAHTKLVSKAEVNGIHFDIVCFEEKYWQHLLHQNIIWIYVFETLGGEEHPRVLVKRKNFEVKIRWQMMHYQALIDFSKNEKYMKMFWIKMKKYNKTKKKIIYILQHLEFAIQIFERGTIYDL